MDSSFDSRAEPTTTRAAWDEIRDNLERGTRSHILKKYRPRLTTITEASTREAFMNSLEVDVIKPLAALKASLKLLVGGGFTNIGTCERKQKIRLESGSRRISGTLPQITLITQRTRSQSSSKRTRRNITPMTMVSSMFQTRSSESRTYFGIGENLTGPSLRNLVRREYHLYVPASFLN